MLAGKRVLVVEDEYFIAQDLRNALTSANAKVVGPVSGRESVPDLEAVDLAILDINLLGAVDFSIADALAEREIPFVFATGYEEAIVPPRHRGAPLWRKPYRVEELIASLSNLLP